MSQQVDFNVSMRPRSWSDATDRRLQSAGPGPMMPTMDPSRGGKRQFFFSD